MEVTGNQLSYQWQIKTSFGFINLSNSVFVMRTETDRLIFGPVKLKDNGIVFRSNMSDGTCIKNSIEVVLEVLKNVNRHTPSEVIDK
ncbi:hypothetical protein BH23THE1_BH23THE1_34770 [soil metagenome]